METKFGGVGLFIMMSKSKGPDLIK
jgi:hypothetical protein